MKKCNICGEFKKLDYFPIYKKRRKKVLIKYYRGCCKKCLNKKRREIYSNNKEKYRAIGRAKYRKYIEKSLIRSRKYYKENREWYKKNYERYYYDFYNYPKMLYKYARSRLIRCKSYKNRKLLFTKEWFVDFAVNDNKFKRLYKQWVVSGFDKSLSPTLDRVDNNGNYSKSNIQFLSKKEHDIKDRYVKGCKYRDSLGRFCKPF